MKLPMFVLSCALLGKSFFATAGEKDVRPHVLSRLSASTDADAPRKIYVYSKEKLSSVRFRAADQEQWFYMQPAADQPGYFIYATPKEQVIAPGAVFQVVGVTQTYLQVLDQLTATDGDILNVTGVSEVQLAPPVEKPKLVALDLNTIYNGSTSVDPQTLAVARAQEMARQGVMTHLGSGMVMTSMGLLAEGVGAGGPNCGTCTATNGTAAVGDGQAVGAGGTTFRCRLYNSPGTGGMGGGHGRGRRGR